MTQFTEAICIELSPDECDALLLILNEARAKLLLPVDHDVYRLIIEKLGTIHSEKHSEHKIETRR